MWKITENADRTIFDFTILHASNMFRAGRNSTGFSNHFYSARVTGSVSAIRVTAIANMADLAFEPITNALYNNILQQMIYYNSQTGARKKYNVNKTSTKQNSIKYSTSNCQIGNVQEECYCQDIVDEQQCTSTIR